MTMSVEVSALLRLRNVWMRNASVHAMRANRLSL